MTAADKAALRALAEKATPGEWVAKPSPEPSLMVYVVVEHDFGGFRSDQPICDAIARDAAYIAAAHPAAVLSLLDENARLREALDGLLRINEEWNAAMIRVAGRPPNWTDEYLGKARAALEPSA